MELAGLIVRAQPAYLSKLQRTLVSVPGLEIHHADPSGRIIITLEQDTSSALSSSMSKLQAIDNILSISLVYQHSETDDEPADPDFQSSCQSNIPNDPKCPDAENSVEQERLL